MRLLLLRSLRQLHRFSLFRNFFLCVVLCFEGFQTLKIGELCLAFTAQFRMPSTDCFLLTWLKKFFNCVRYMSQWLLRGSASEPYAAVLRKIRNNVCRFDPSSQYGYTEVVLCGMASLRVACKLVQISFHIGIFQEGMGNTSAFRGFKSRGRGIMGC